MGVGIQITVLGSGSAGNCALVETETTRVLVDAGLSARQISQRLASIGRRITDIHGILLTHEHSDHIRALGVLCKANDYGVYANRLTAEAVAEDPDWNAKVRISWRLFTTGQPFEIGDLTIEPFSVPHDAYDPVGFLIRNQTNAIGIVTDLGHATKLVIERLKTAGAVVIEANHDLKLLQEETSRPWALKQRIMSRHGHMSNEAAATLAGELASERLQHVLLAHLSRDCNRPELARDMVSRKLRQIGASHVTVTVTSQDIPTATISLNGKV
ncbi:MAG: MBL fold metallo-hydrolase [Verrucomicrobiia bacterium]